MKFTGEECRESGEFQAAQPKMTQLHLSFGRREGMVIKQKTLNIDSTLCNNAFI